VAGGECHENVHAVGLAVHRHGHVIVVCGLIFLALAIGMIATLLGNLAIWPIIGSAIIGYPITFPMAIGIAAVMAVIIYMFAGSVSRQTEDKMGAIVSLGCFRSILIPILGFPLWMVLVYFNGGQLTGWAIIPCGIVTALLIWAWISRKTPDDTTGSRP
jgi:MFS family permease